MDQHEEPSRIVATVFGEGLFTVKEVADFFKIADTTVREWISKGELMAVKYGKEYRISETALRESKEAKEQEQRKAFKQRRAEIEWRVELERRKQRDPAARWEITNCVACGLEPAFTTRHMRLDGEVLCGSCDGQLRETKDYWERKVTLMISERNSAYARSEFAGPWKIYRCEVCGRPEALPAWQLKDQSFYPRCYHGTPFGSGLSMSAEEAQGRLDSRVIAALAHLEVALRVEENPEPDWRKAACAHCGLDLAVSSRETRLIGASRCRACLQSEKELDQFWSGSIVLNALIEECGSETAYTWRYCNCGHTEIHDDTGEGDQSRLLLSWCPARSAAERKALALDYAKSLCLSPEATWQLAVSISTKTDLDTIPF